MRKKIAAGNWKMNLSLNQALELAEKIKNADIPTNAEIILGVPFLYLSDVKKAVAGSPIQLAAQNAHQKISGAFTGEISPSMLASMGIPYVILGHSERRELFGEGDDLLAEKVKTALSQGLKVIFCCGESLPVREKGNHLDFVKYQIEKGLFDLEPEFFGSIMIAYEPIWAIGTGVTASKEQAQEMHREIRKLLQFKYGHSVSEKTNILYGGSVKPDNARELFNQPDVDGGLVGGASLKADDFISIIHACGNS